MKISLCNEVLAGHDFARQCELAKQMGYDGLEVAPVTLSDEPHLLSMERRREIRTIAEDHGVPVTGLHYLMVAPKGLSITAQDAAIRTRTIDVIRRLIGLAHDLGGKIIVHGSPATSPARAGARGRWAPLRHRMLGRDRKGCGGRGHHLLRGATPSARCQFRQHGRRGGRHRTGRSAARQCAR